MKADGSIIIDTKIVDGGMEKGFEKMKDEMESVGVAVEQMGDEIKLTFAEDVSKPIKDAVEKVQELEEKLEVASEGFYNATYSDDDKGAEKWAEKREQAYDRLEQAQKKLTQVVVTESEKQADAQRKSQEKSFKNATKGARSFGKRLTSIISGALIFNLISKGLREMTEYFGKALKSNQKFVDTSNKLKGALLTAFQPLYETLLPAIIAGMEVLAKYALMIGRFFSSITGKSAAQMKENASALYDQAEATEEAGNAAKKASQQIGGFDELNVMQNQHGGSADFNLEGLDLNSKLTEMVVMGSEAILALGVLLALSGLNIPLGIFMIAMGAALLYQSVAENWGALGGRVATTLDVILTIIYGALFVIGVILAFSGANILLGIGMIIAGATGMASEVGLNWNAIREMLQTPIGAIIGLLGGALLVAIGFLVCFAGGWPLGIGLIVAGAAFLATTVAVNWNTITEALRGPIGALVVLISGALLVVGILLCLSGVGIPLGIGLLAAGATGLVTTVAVNWDALKEPIMSVLASILAIISGASLVIGVLLCLSGAGIGLGLALIFAGIKGSTAAWNLSDNPITRFVKNLANGIIGIINTIADAINDLFHIDFKGLKIAGAEIIPAFNAQLIRLPKIPMLAQGAVIPPNKEFMAVLGDQRHGTNIEAPLATIEDAVARVTGQQSEQMIAALYTLIDIVERKDLNVQIGDDDIGRANARYTQTRGVQVNTGAFANAY